MKVASGQCLEFAQRPYGPLLDVLEHFEPGAGHLKPAASKREHFDAIVAAFQRIARRTAIIVVLEDVHWSDTATIEVVDYMLTKLESLRILVIASYRSDELHAEHPVRSVISKIERSSRAGQVALVPLSGQNLRKFIDEALTGIDLPNEVRRAVAHTSEGNPFFIEELLKSAVQRGPSHARNAGRLPATVSSALLERLRPFTADERRVLGQAAVIGRRFDLGILAETLHLEVADVLPTLQRAHDFQLIEEESPTTFRFRHTLTREAIYGGFLSARLRSLHRNIATVLEGQAMPNQSPATLAYHWDAAGDAPRAARYGESAGDEAGAVYAHDDAIVHFSRALAHTPSPSRDAARLLSKIGFHGFANGFLTAARDAYRRAASMFAEFGSLEDEVTCCSRISRCSYMLDDPNPTTATEALLARIPSGERRLRAMLHVAIGAMHAAGFQPERAKLHLEGVDSAALAGHWRSLYQYHNASALLASLAGDVEELRSQFRLAAAASKRGSDPLDQAVVEVNVGQYLSLAGQPREGLTHIERGVRLGHEYRVRPTNEPRAHALAAHANLLLGDLAAVRRELDLVHAMPSENLMVTAHAAAWGTLAALHTGDDTLIQRWFDDVEGRVPETGLRFYAAGFAEILHRRGRIAESHALLRRALAVECARRGLFMTMLAVARFGDLDDAGNARALLVREAAAPDVPDRPALALFDAYVSSRRGDRAAAAAHAQEAVDGFRRFEYSLYVAAALEIVGDIGAARTIYRRTGALADARRLGDEPAKAMDNAPASPLSSREYEIAALAKSGSSNREIGRRLSISHKTVEKHMTAIYQKLGISSRSRLAAYLSRPDPS